LTIINSITRITVTDARIRMQTIFLFFFW